MVYSKKKFVRDDIASQKLKQLKQKPEEKIYSCETEMETNIEKKKKIKFCMIMM